MKFSINKISLYVRVFLLAAILAAAGYAFFFLKTYFYPALTGSQTILVIQRNLAADAINLNQFNELIANVDKKTSQTPDQSAVSDPFK